MKCGNAKTQKVLVTQLICQQLPMCTAVVFHHYQRQPRHQDLQQQLKYHQQDSSSKINCFTTNQNPPIAALERSFLNFKFVDVPFSVLRRWVVQTATTRPRAHPPSHTPSTSGSSSVEPACLCHPTGDRYCKTLFDPH